MVKSKLKTSNLMLGGIGGRRRRGGQRMRWLDGITDSMGMGLSCYNHAFRETNSLRRTIQFITPAGPRQSLFLAKDPHQHL